MWRSLHAHPNASRPSRGPIRARTASSATSRGRKTSIQSPCRSSGSLGGLDVLVNSASSLGPAPLALLADTDCEDFELALATNVLGPFRLTKALLGALTASARAGRGGVVLNISSDAAVNAYSAVGRLRREQGGAPPHEPIWDEELAAEGVRFLSIDPGDMDTPLHALAVPGRRSGRR